MLPAVTKDGAGTSVMHTTLDELETATTNDAAEGRWRAGVNRQALPGARDHQVAAGKAGSREQKIAAGQVRQALPNAQSHQKAASMAAAAKRKADAMPEEERKLKRAAHMREVRERQRRARAAALETMQPQPTRRPAPIVVVPTRAEFNECLQGAGYEMADAQEWSEFEEDGAFEGAGPGDLERHMLLELFLEWRGSDRQQQREMEHQINEWAQSDKYLNSLLPPAPMEGGNVRSELGLPPLEAVPGVNNSHSVPPSLLPLWPQPTWQNMSRSQRAPTFRLVFADSDTTVVHAGAWQDGGPGRSLAGGHVASRSIVRDGVHEFTFMLQRVHASSRPPILGLIGTRHGFHGQDEQWQLGLSLDDGSLRFTYGAETDFWRTLYNEPNLCRWPGRNYDVKAGAPASRLLLEVPTELPLCVSVRIDFSQSTISFRLGCGEFQTTPSTVLDACCSAFRSCRFNPAYAQPFVSFADVRVPCKNEGGWPCHTYWCGCNVVGSEEGTTVRLLHHQGAPAPPPPPPPQLPPPLLESDDPNEGCPPDMWYDRLLDNHCQSQLQQMGNYGWDYDWDTFVDVEYARASGELWWYTGTKPLLVQPGEREQRRARERAAGPPLRRENSEYGIRDDPLGDVLFRTDRIQWYNRFTGRSIASLSLAEQNEAMSLRVAFARTRTEGRVHQYHVHKVYGLMRACVCACRVSCVVCRVCVPDSSAKSWTHER